MFENAFKEVLALYTPDNKLINIFWIEIVSAYSGSHRRYHNLDHLENLYKELLPIRKAINDWETILFSIAYHDIVYSTVKSNNEENSAKLAVFKLTKLGLQKDRIELCSNQILATKTHSANEIMDTNYFVDADLSILGYEFPIYLQYSRQIRQEFQNYPDLIYKPGRKKVLLQFLAGDRIFKTDHFFNLYEKQARINLADELKSLA